MLLFSFEKKTCQLLSGLRKPLQLLFVTALFLLGSGASGNALHAQTRKLIDIVHIQPFRLEKSFRFDWRKERPEVRNGLLVVIKIDTSMLRPTEGLQPVLYAGNHPIQRINLGYASGFLVGIIPAQIDLSKDPVWFGSPYLPERIDAAYIKKERVKASEGELLRLPGSLLSERTKESVVSPNLSTLLHKQAGDLILQYAPQEKRIVEAWRLPETRQ